MYHPIVEKIVGELEGRGMWHEVFEHEPVRTSEEASLVRPNYNIKQGAKAIIIRAKDGGNKYFVMLVVPGDKRFDGTKVKQYLGVSDIRFATEEEVAGITWGVEPGGVPPWGNLFGLRVVADPGIFENEKMIFNAGDRRVSVAMMTADYKEIVAPEVAVIVI